MCSTATAWSAKVGHSGHIAYNADGDPRPGAAVVEVTGLLDLSRRPVGMRVIVRRERRTRLPSCA